MGAAGHTDRTACEDPPFQNAPRRRGTYAPRLLDGLEAGVIGGLAMLAFFVLDSLGRHHRWWAIPNLLGSAFYGVRAFRMGPGIASASGIALQLTISGIAGVVFALALAAAPNRLRTTWAGIAAGLIWFAIAQRVLFPEIGPLVARYAPEPATLLANLVFGVCLGRFPYRVESDTIRLETESGQSANAVASEIPGRDPTR
ncbi:MAG: hypothetical protein ABI165_15050 [Bryobacteraceae bacterium]